MAKKDKAAAKVAKRARQQPRGGGVGLSSTVLAIVVVVVAVVFGWMVSQGPSSSSSSSPSSVVDDHDTTGRSASATTTSRRIPLKEDSVEERALTASNLMAALEAAGATQHVTLNAKATPTAGVTIVVAVPVKAGESLLTIPSDLFLTPHTLDEAGLAATLLKHHLAKTSASNSNSETIQQYLTSLPRNCPDNVVMWSEKQLELVSLSLHHWKLDMMEEARERLTDEFPTSTESEREWAICMVLSRSFSPLLTKSSVMIPYIDLFNHNANPTVYLASHPDRMVVVAARDLDVGDEITFEYLASPSRARLLTSFGFGSERDAPAASLAAKDLPARDPKWLAEQGCPEPPRTNLELNSDGIPDDKMIRDGIRCIRLRLYTPPETEWALENGHLDAPWAGPLVTKSDGVLADILQKDLLVLANTGRLCNSVLPQKQEEMKELHTLIAKGSSSLHRAVRDETTALMGCSHLMQQAYGVVSARLGQ